MTESHVRIEERKEEETFSGSQISMRNEFLRKGIHLCSITIPIGYIWFSRLEALRLLIPATVLSLLMELLRLRVPAFRRWFNRLFGGLLRPHELNGRREKMSGATYVLLSATLCVLIFPKVITVAGFAILIVSDTASALFGRRFGRHKFRDKSFEGSAAFFVTAIGVVLAVAAVYSAPWEFIAVGVGAALAATVAEALSNGVTIDDNLSIPLTFGGVAWGVLALIDTPEVRRILEVP